MAPPVQWVAHPQPFLSGVSFGALAVTPQRMLATTIGAGATVTKDVPSGVLSVNRGRQTNIENWTRPSKGKKAP